MYSIATYGVMISNEIRMDAYVEALRRAIKPGSVVLDIGTGPGVFAIIACQLGARKVYALEPDSSIYLGPDIAAANGVADRIEFIQDLSTRITLPEQVDVVLSDLRGVLPLFQAHIPSIADARKRLMKPGGIQIPQKDVLWLAVINTPNLYNYLQNPWLENKYGVDMTKGYPLVANMFHKGRAKEDQIVLPPQPWATLDYTTIEDPDVRGEVTWTVERDSMAHGFNVWFETTLLEGIGFSTSPLAPELIYSTAFFPWLKPVSLCTGDTVTISLYAKYASNEYIWKWNTLVKGRDGEIKADFKQSTFLGWTLTSDDFKKRMASHVPKLNQDGKILRLTIDMMDNNTSLSVIAEKLTSEFPVKFPTKEQAMAYVGTLSADYSE